MTTAMNANCYGYSFIIVIQMTIAVVIIPSIDGIIILVNLNFAALSCLKVNQKPSGNQRTYFQPLTTT